MANPAVEKLKDFGIRHGEKVAVGVAGDALPACSSSGPSSTRRST